MQSFNYFILFMMKLKQLKALFQNGGEVNHEIQDTNLIELLLPEMNSVEH
jgi:hypothetical protein